MSEAGFYLFNNAFSAVTELIYAALLAAFFQPFIPNKEQKRWKLLIVFAAYILFYLACSRAALPQGTFGIILTALLLAAARWTGLEKSLVFLLILLYFNARISSGLMAESLHFLLEQWLPFPVEPLEKVFLHAAIFLTLFLLSHAALFFLMLYTLRRQMIKRRFPLHRRELCYLSLVPMTGILFGQVISRLLIEFKDGVLLQLYDRHPAFLAIVPILALLFYTGTWLTIAFQQGMAALQEEQAALYAEQQQARTIRARIHEAERFYASIRQLKHEMRGHLTNIKGLVQSGKYASIEQYIARMDESMGSFELTLQTGNPVTDVIVNDTR